MEIVKRERKQIHRSADEWNGIIKEWQSSGKTIKAWSKEKGLSCESLRRWKKRFGKPTTESHFVQISRLVSVSLPTIRIRLRGSVEIELSGDPSENILRRVIHAVMEETHVS